MQLWPMRGAARNIHVTASVLNFGLVSGLGIRRPLARWDRSVIYQIKMKECLLYILRLLQFYAYGHTARNIHNALNGQTRLPKCQAGKER